MKSLKRGDYVLIRFLDHVEDGNQPMECMVVGRLLYKGKSMVGSDGKRRGRWVVLESWFFPEDTPRDIVEANNKTFSILWSTVVDYVRLVPDNGMQIVQGEKGER